MDKRELRAATSLAAVFSVRLLGLFMIYPVFSDYARGLSGAIPYKIGLALGVYGLSQGLLQIPFGVLSDKFGRKVIIVLGLTLFGIGSAVAAMSNSIDGMIVGRLLQGSGAVGSAILALVADLTSEESRTKAMALVGITIGIIIHDRSGRGTYLRWPCRSRRDLLADGRIGAARYWHHDIHCAKSTRL